MFLYCTHPGSAAFRFTSKAVWQGFSIDLEASWCLLVETVLLSPTGTSFQDAPEQPGCTFYLCSSGPGHRGALGNDDLGVDKKQKLVLQTGMYRKAFDQDVCSVGDTPCGMVLK